MVVFSALKPQVSPAIATERRISRKERNHERIIGADASVFADKARCVLITITLRLYYRTGSD